MSGILGIKNHHIDKPIISPAVARKEVTVIEMKKRKTDENSELDEPMDLNTELMLDSDIGPLEDANPNNLVSKNGKVAGTQESASLGL